MNTETVPKRGRPKKAVDEMIQLPAAPKLARKPSSSTPAPKPAKKVVSKPASKASTSKLKAGVAKTVKTNTDVPIPPLVDKISKPPKPVVLKNKSKLAMEPDELPEAVSDSKIVQEIALLNAKKSSTEVTGPREKVEPTNSAIAATVNHDYGKISEIPPSLTAASVPMPVFSIPSQQSSTMPSSLLYLHNPGTVTLQRAAYMSTKSNPQPPKARIIPKKPYVSPVAIHQLADELQPSRPGHTGAHKLKGSTPKMEAGIPGKLPAKYKPAARRVTAIIVGLPVFFVTSYFLYERIILGVPVKEFPRPLPKASPEPPQTNSAVT